MAQEDNFPKFKRPIYKKEDTLKLLYASISKYSKQGNIKLEKIEYREQDFEDILIELGTNTDLHFTIVRDRWQVECNVEIPNKKNDHYYLDDVFNILEIQYEPVPVDIDITEAIDKFLKILIDNMAILQEAFNKKNRKSTTKILHRLLEERAKKRWGKI